MAHMTRIILLYDHGMVIALLTGEDYETDHQSQSDGINLNYNFHDTKYPWSQSSQIMPFSQRSSESIMCAILSVCKLKRLFGFEKMSIYQNKFSWS